MATGRAKLGIIGGSGLYALPGLRDVKEQSITTSFGDPSDCIISGVLGDTELLFLPRHGRGHRLPPHRINYRANVLALKLAGAEQVLSISAVGSMQEHIRPGDLVVVDQFIDRTTGRARSFFDEAGAVAHVSFADPVDRALRQAVLGACAEANKTSHDGGTYVCIDGPQFSTRAESKLFRSWGADVIGMTNLPEARLAREAQLPYATLAIATDYDCWHESEEDVSIEAILAILRQGMEDAKEVLAKLVDRLPDPKESPASSALAEGLFTAPEAIPDSLREKLGELLAK